MAVSAKLGCSHAPSAGCTKRAILHSAGRRIARDHSDTRGAQSGLTSILVVATIARRRKRARNSIVGDGVHYDMGKKTAWVRSRGAGIKGGLT